VVVSCCSGGQLFQRELGGRMKTRGKPETADWAFRAMAGGEFGAGDMAGRVVLLVNTASHCGLQALQDRYGADLLVLAVPSDDFHQEEPDDAAVQSFCERNYGLRLKMTGITRITGSEAHPLYRWLAAQGFVPEWNFAKVLFDREGRLAETFPANAEPLGGAVEAALQRELGESGSP
jgi:glutathione peroxidase